METIKKESQENTEDLLTRLLIIWNMKSFSPGYDPKKYDEEIAQQFLVKVIRKKLEAVGVDVVIPDYLALILNTCATNPAEIQMITVDILEQVRKNNKNKIPVGYVITPNDFSAAFPRKFPLIEEDSCIREHYDKIWKKCKIGNHNMYDTKHFWRKYKNV
jgi:hypothetical protein